MRTKPTPIFVDGKLIQLYKVQPTMKRLSFKAGDKVKFGFSMNYDFLWSESIPMIGRSYGSLRFPSKHSLWLK